jgi:hypothetical protein
MTRYESRRGPITYGTYTFQRAISRFDSRMLKSLFGWSRPSPIRDMSISREGSFDDDGVSEISKWRRREATKIRISC